jgi:hypothetical protein
MAKKGYIPRRNRKLWKDEYTDKLKQLLSDDEPIVVSKLMVEFGMSDSTIRNYVTKIAAEMEVRLKGTKHDDIITVDWAKEILVKDAKKPANGIKYVVTCRADKIKVPLTTLASSPEEAKANILSTYSGVTKILKIKIA